MLSILGSLIGFGTSIVPEVLGFFKQSQANKQELLMLEAKAKYAEQLSTLKLKEIDAKADIAEAKGIYEHDRAMKSEGFVSQLRASVRPVLTYLFFRLVCHGESFSFGNSNVQRSGLYPSYSFSLGPRNASNF
jgi:hypothetical protein